MTTMKNCICTVQLKHDHNFAYLRLSWLAITMLTASSCIPDRENALATPTRYACFILYPASVSDYYPMAVPKVTVCVT